LSARFLLVLPMCIAGLSLSIADEPPSRDAMAAAISGDPDAGAAVFGQCRACHVADAPSNRVGPHLVGLFGRVAGSVDGFNYSDAMRESGIVWTPETLSIYLADPRGAIPGNRMTFGGVRDEGQRANLIAYLFQVTAGEPSP
jgi:cytochrome c